MQLNPYQSPTRCAEEVEVISSDLHSNCEPSRHTLECVQFILRALVLTTRDKQLSPKGIANAAGVCRVVLELACDLFGEAGIQQLLGWGVVRSEDVGTIVYRLIDARLVAQAKDDSIDDFSGLFDLEQPPEIWKLQW